MNASRIIKGGLVAGLLINVSEFVLNTLVVPVPEGGGGSLVFWVAYAFLLGFVVAYMSALARGRWGAGQGRDPRRHPCVAAPQPSPGGGHGEPGLMDLSLVGLAWTLVELSLAGVLAGCSTARHDRRRRSLQHGLTAGTWILPA